MAINNEYDIFTFQYVSIISSNLRCREYQGCIYIPICFYYFFSDVSEKIPLAPFTFQYVSIISGLRWILSVLSESFTFQYVSIIS